MLAFLPSQTAANSSRTRSEKNVPRATPDAAIDTALIARFVAGDEAAFVELMNRYHAKIFNVTLGLLRNHADAEEITQDAFIRAHRGLAKFRGDSSFATWLYRIAVNLSRNRYWHFFRRHRQDSLSLNCALSDASAATFADLVADSGADPAQETVSAEFCALVDRCMQRLDTRHREILTLRNVLNHSYDEIATTLQVNVGTVKSRIARAREHLRALLAEACPEFAPGAGLGEWFLPAHAVYGQPAIASA